MKRTGALVTLSLPFIPSITSTNSQPAAQLATPFSLLLRVAAIESNKSTEQVSFKTIAKGARSGVREPSQIVIRSQSEWQKLWRQHTSPSTVSAPLPAVDFDKEMVAAVFLGEKPTGGYDIEIVSVERSDDTLTVTFKEGDPQPGGITTQAFTQPFHIVSISIEGTPSVRFRRTP